MEGHHKGSSRFLIASRMLILQSGYSLISGGMPVLHWPHAEWAAKGLFADAELAEDFVQEVFFEGFA